MSVPEKPTIPIGPLGRRKNPVSKMLLPAAALTVMAVITAIGFWARLDSGRKPATSVPQRTTAKMGPGPKQLGPPLPDQSTVEAEIEKLGGRFDIDEEAADHPVVGVYLATGRVTDANLECLRGLTQLEELYLEGAKITDAGLKHLQGLTHLQVLDLSGTEVGDAGMELLKGLSQLEVLDLSDTKVTDAGLQHLKELTQLRELDLWRTEVTDAAATEFQEALPSCRMER
jgi:hypothetical protein